MKKICLFALLLMIIVSGCSSVIANSEKYYQNQPRRPINWREYLTD
ncbi:MAG TPA: lipoprotein [Candidatus Binatia bacterium]|nr:lipoprotein [Candidatus Binatia bacterium]